MPDRLSLCAGLICLAGCLGARAEDWPQFRGPTGQGLARVEGLPVRWGPDRHIAWKTALPGAGWSSPVLHDGRLYLTAAVPLEDRDRPDRSLRAICLNAADGMLVWNTAVFETEEADTPGIHKKNSHASPTPLVAGDRIYVHFGHQGTACLDLAGRVIWRQDTLRYPPVHGAGGSPVLVDGKLIFSCDGGKNPFVVALDSGTGEVAWKTFRGMNGKRPFSFSTPLAITVDGRTQVVSPGSDAVVAYDPATGKPIWRVRYEDGYSVVPRPVYGHGLVYVCTGFNRPTLLAIRPTGTGDLTDTHVAWKTSRAVPHTPSPVLVGDELYMVSDGGVASCLDARTGEEHWRERIGGKYSASPIHAEGRIYFLSESGEAVVVEASKQFRVIARNDLDERSLASFAATDGALFLRTVEGVYRIENGP